MTSELITRDPRQPLIQSKYLLHANPQIMFGHIDPEESKNQNNLSNVEQMVIEIPSVITPMKPEGRPKNERLSALAAKRGRKPKKSTLTAQSSSDCVGKSKNESNDKDVKIPEPIQRSQKNGLTSTGKIAIRQNISHMANQIRGAENSELCTNDLIPLTNDLKCDSTDGVLIKRMRPEPSRGFAMLFPGQREDNRDLYVAKTLHSHQFLKSSPTDKQLIRTPGIELKQFDFTTCPVAAIMMDHKSETDLKRKRKERPKKLMKPKKPVQKKAVQKPVVKEVLAVARLLKKRVKQHEMKIPRVAIIGPQSSGKSTLIGQLIRILKSDDYERVAPKLKWEAQKCGRPHEFIAWLVDELEGERTHGRSRDVGEVTVTLPSGKAVHLMDSPGDVDKVSLTSDVIALADACVLVVDAVRQEDCEQKKQILDIFQLIKHHRCVGNLKSFTNLTVIINKMDSFSWSKAAVMKFGKSIAAIKSEVPGLDDVKITLLPISARSSEGILKSTRETEKKNDCYMCKTTFMDVLENLSAVVSVNAEPQPVDRQPLCAVVSDVYENMGAGFTAVVQVKEGVLSPGQAITCSPTNKTAQVRTVQVIADGKLMPVNAAVSGEMAHVVLWQIGVQEVLRGSVLCDSAIAPSVNDHSARRFVTTACSWVAEIKVVDLNRLSIIPGRQVTFHSFSSTSPAYLRRLLWVSEPKGCDNQRSKSTERTEEEENVLVRPRPSVVSTPNVVVRVELCIEDPHSCRLDSSINTDFLLFDGRTLFATGVLLEASDLCEIKTGVDSCDANGVFHRSSPLEEIVDMDIGDDMEDS